MSSYRQDRGGQHSDNSLGQTLLSGSLKRHCHCDKLDNPKVVMMSMCAYAVCIENPHPYYPGCKKGPLRYFHVEQGKKFRGMT